MVVLRLYIKDERFASSLAVAIGLGDGVTVRIEGLYCPDKGFSFGCIYTGFCRRGRCGIGEIKTQLGAPYILR